MEAFGIVEACSKVDDLLMNGERFDLLTDHWNLIYIFDPKATNPSVTKDAANRVERWAMKWTQFD